MSPPQVLRWQRWMGQSWLFAVVSSLPSVTPLEDSWCLFEKVRDLLRSRYGVGGVSQVVVSPLLRWTLMWPPARHIRHGTAHPPIRLPRPAVTNFSPAARCRCADHDLSSHNVWDINSLSPLHNVTTVPAWRLEFHLWCASTCLNSLTHFKSWNNFMARWRSD